MTAVRDQVLRQILNQIQQGMTGDSPVQEIFLETAEFQIAVSELAQHIDQLRSQAWIKVEAQETLETAVVLRQARVTDAGLAQLQSASPSTPELPSIAFLERVRNQAGLEDLYDARDITEVVFRTMRDLMTNAASDRVASELTAQALPTEDQALGKPISDLWKDTNPLVAFLSRLRQPLQIKSETFLFRVQQEAGLQRGISAERVVTAVFSATKAELSQERIQEIATVLPDEIRQLWQRA